MNATDWTMYALDSEQWRRLESIRLALYGDGTQLTADKRRDLANLLTAVMDSAEKFDERQLKSA